MNHAFTNNDRVNFVEQVHQEFLYMKGYGTYAYITSHDVDDLFDAYRLHHHSIKHCVDRQLPEIAFIRSYIKSLRQPSACASLAASGDGMKHYQDL